MSLESAVALTKSRSEGNDDFLKEVFHTITKAPGRSLKSQELQELIQNGNTCNDWSLIKVLTSKRLSSGRIRNCVFQGHVHLGSFGETVSFDKSLQLDDGCYQSTIVDSTICSGSLVSNTHVLARAYVAKGALVMNCGMVTSSNPTKIKFGNGISIPVGCEAGGREVTCYATMSLEIATAVSCNRDHTSSIASFNEFVKKYVESIPASRVIIAPHACVRGSTLEDVFVGPYAIVESSKLEQCTLLSGKGSDQTKISGMSFIKNALIQWGCVVEGLSFVSNSLMCEQSHVERHGKLIDSILGPCSGVAEGECTSSLVGPFVGFHHQSLLIACIWPEGKGNIGYGANVGSNHTGKANDQEIWPGEGTFFGLSTAIKYPANYSKSPYSMIATGVTTLPQKVEFPFSLINSTSESINGISPAFNEISPGWVVSSNMYMLIRNETKYQSRNTATRTKYQLHWQIMRPDIIDLCIQARDVLIKAEGKSRHLTASGEKVFSSDIIPSLGKNYMTESSRKAGIKAYTQYIHYYALCGLLEAILSNKLNVSLTTLAKDLPDNIENQENHWDHKKFVLQKEFSTITVFDLLVKLKALSRQIAVDVLKSKEKDDKRGPEVIPDYSHVVVPAAKQKVVIKAFEISEKIQKNVDSVLKNSPTKSNL
eukprot:c20134_g1_i1.p1 GENE.c20134_g1_i1~~c20134_g1_i1.p1  ORF type:complete len:653 (+),score=252.01 c20134_g1_i1:27-1985(+)